MENKKYCNNCGNFGHQYKNCRHPILSYGIILYYDTCNEGRKIILIERKDSLSYIEFLRGKYSSIYDIKYLKLLFSRLSRDELNRINEYTFDKLWSDLWIHTDTINHRIRKEYSKSKNKFYLLKKGYKLKDEYINIEYLVNSVSDIYEENEWELPKGRRKKYENNRDCAIREFKEETNIINPLYDIIDNIIPLVEEYVGINNVKYKHVYYIAKLSEYCDLKIDMENKDQYTEIKSIKWVSEEECYSKIRDYNKTKLEIISKFFNFSRDFNRHVVICD